MKKNFLAILALAFAVAIAPSCSDDDSSSKANSSTYTEVESTYTVLGTEDTDVTMISGVIYDETITLSKGVNYLINSPVIVASGATLEIEAGATIYAQPQFASYLLVLQGGKINAEGTATSPIEFLSAIEGEKWGGVILNGYATISGENSTGNTGSTEIASQYKYGGSDDSDDSGVLKYIILRDTGANNGADVEHNGLTLNGVGNSTTIENIYVDATLDDGIEFFGGTVNVKNLLVVNPDDDMFDFTQGYSGTLTNAYGVWEATHTSGEEDPRGVEADGNLDGKYTSHLSQSDFKIVNMTIENNRTTANGTASSYDKMHDAIKVRRGAKATITNAVINGFTTQTISDVIDLYDSRGMAAEGTDINLSVALASSLYGNLVNYGATSVYDESTYVASENGDVSYADAVTAYNTAKESAYSKIVIADADANVGCAQSEFTWTGYFN